MQDYDKIIANKNEKLSKGAKKGLTFFLILLSIAILLVIVNIFFGNSVIETRTKNTDTSNTILQRIEEGTSINISRGNSIAVVYIEGTIQSEGETYNQEWLINLIDDLMYDSANSGIMLFINSPGGGVYQSDDVYLALEKYKEISGNTIWAYFGPLAASGGYYIGCAADTIYANRNTLTGSIGVISSQSLDLTELMDNYGIKMTTITAGDNKNMMNVNSPLTEEQVAIMQSIADEAYDQFTTIVSNSREMDIEKVRELADGRIYTAYQAKENGLIDEVASFEDTISDMEDLVFEGENMNVLHYYYEQEEASLFDLLLDLSASSRFSQLTKETLDIQEISERLGLPKGMEYPAYYYHK